MEKTFTGIISEAGKLKIYESGVFSAFVATQKNKRVFITLQTEEPTATKFTIIYWQKVVCASFVEIFKSHYGEYNTVEVVSQRLREWCPVAKDEAGEVIPLEEMTQEQLNYLIKHSKMIASTEFDYYIPD